MATIREVVFDQLRAWGMTTVYGNPGSTELSFLRDFPADFRYILGLQEAAVVGMADAHAQVTARPTLVNLHTAAGLGNAMGAIINAAANKTPLVITAGQQTRAMITLEALLTNVDATTLPRPAVKWSFEPPRAADVPAALARARLIADTPPRGPVFLSLPMDDFDAEVDEQDEGKARTLAKRTVAATTAGDPQALAALAERLAAAENPALVCGSEVDADGVWQDAVALAERLQTPVWSAPIEGRVTFPQSHWLFRGHLPPAIGPLAKALDGHDLVVVLGAPVFRYYPYVPGEYLPAGTALAHITSDPGEAARAPVGDAIIADVGYALQTLLDLIPDPKKPVPAICPPAPGAVPDDTGVPLEPGAVFAALAAAVPGDARWAHESPSNTQFFQDHVKLDRPGSYYMTAGGGLGFGLAAGVGAQIADPSRPVVALMGDGSMQYAICALWTAAAYKVPLTIVVLANAEYAILKWFGAFERADGVPGLDITGLDTAAIAAGYGVRSHRVTSAAQLASLLGEAIAAKDGPTLIEVPIKTVFPSM
ncbi:benzoylformate decarboxylase [Actinorhabdospora filicis]|uniref:Benzoylformate decarboxylase n=1 Tax=Actinorhabdospora filicis TaxID=1785913 RepID=A0A9W6SPS6_9ACTN|nr:benzoylformate decarboxylase [Actinorhabdospora filicis]GLZ79888.1 benzoylformate decarboxylase [Actinorhabdospora filicis]